MAIVDLTIADCWAESAHGIYKKAGDEADWSGVLDF